MLFTFYLSLFPCYTHGYLLYVYGIFIKTLLERIQYILTSARRQTDSLIEPQQPRKERSSTGRKGCEVWFDSRSQSLKCKNFKHPFKTKKQQIKSNLSIQNNC